MIALLIISTYLGCLQDTGSGVGGGGGGGGGYPRQPPHHLQQHPYLHRQPRQHHRAAKEDKKKKQGFVKKTLDKIASTTLPGVQQQQQQQQPQQQQGDRLSKSSSPSNKAHHSGGGRRLNGRLAAQPGGALLYPWDNYNPSQHQVAGYGSYEDMVFDYPAAAAAAARYHHYQQQQHQYQRHCYQQHQFCACKEQQQVSKGRCQRCQKYVLQVRSPAAQSPGGRPQHPLAYFRDPFERSRLARSAEAEWQRYWVQAEEEREDEEGTSEEEETTSEEDDDEVEEEEQKKVISRKSILDAAENHPELSGVVIENTDGKKKKPSLDTLEESEEEESEEKKKKNSSTKEAPDRRSSRRRLNKYRRTPFQIAEETIQEEEEEDLEAEGIQVVFDGERAPPLKPILKQQSSDSSSEESLTTATTIAGAKKGVTFSGDCREDIGVAKSMRSASSSSPSEHASRAGAMAGSSNSRYSPPRDDDCWGDYDKVIVSHNLAEEILDEIYGSRSAFAQQESGSREDDKSGDAYEELASQKKSMADEILEELYGKNGSRFEDDDDEVVTGSLSDGSREASSKDDIALLWRRRIASECYSVSIAKTRTNSTVVTRIAFCPLP